MRNSKIFTEKELQLLGSVSVGTLLKLKKEGATEKQIENWESIVKKISNMQKEQR